MKNLKLIGSPALERQRNSPASADISERSILRFFLLGLVLVAIADVPNHWGMVFYCAQGVLGLLLLTAFFLPAPKALLLLFLLAVTGQDIVSSAKFSDGFATASIWQMRIGSMNPSWIIFGCLILQMLKTAPLTIPADVKKAILWFATVPVAAGILYGGFVTENAGIEVLIDLKFPLMLLMSMILFLTILKRDPDYLPHLLAAFIGVFLARHAADLVYFIFNWGPAIAEGVSRVSEDSGKGGVVFLIFFGLVVSWRSTFLRRGSSSVALTPDGRGWNINPVRQDSLSSLIRRLFLGPVIAAPAVLLLAAYGTRLLWITFAAGAIVLLSILKSRRSAFVLLILIATGCGGLWALSFINPDSAQIVLVRFRTITEGRAFDDPDAVGVDYNIVSRIDPVRYAETLNILESARERLSYFWGSGYGGYYEDKVAYFPHNLQSAFAQYSFDTGKFYRAHDYFMHIFLKFGLFGLLIITKLWFAPGLALFRIFRSADLFRKGQPLLLHGTMLCVVSFLATAMLQLYWSGKGLFINGMVIASCMEFVRRQRA